MIARHHALRDAILSPAGGWARVCAVALEYGIAIRLRPLPVAELVIGRTVYVDAGQRPDCRLLSAAHGLGHVRLHCGDQRLLARVGVMVVERQESQATRYALFLLCPYLDAEDALVWLPRELWRRRIELEAVCGELAA